MMTPAQGWVPDAGVVAVVGGAIVVDVVVDVLVVDVLVVVGGRVVEVVVGGRVVDVVVGGRVVVVVVDVDVVDVEVDVGGNAPTGGVVPPMVDGTHRLRSGVKRRVRFATLTSKHTHAGPLVTAAGAMFVVTGTGTHSRLGSSTRSRR
jgi:hypothetical protein